jgi:phosphonate metabolism protein PhnN/1,5-bisphosphokinase (PRPP-forming)
MQPGTLFYAVGASGVGKDALINGAIRLLQGTHRYELARRAITRPAGNGEDHEPVDDAEFDARLAKGAFLHTWAAHGLRYGLPSSIVDHLRVGRNVIANGSRANIPAISDDLGRLVIIEITAPREALRDRILSRGPRRPVCFFCTPPHCLKWNATPAFTHGSRIDLTHSGSIGRAAGAGALGGTLWITNPDEAGHFPTSKL